MPPDQHSIADGADARVYRAILRKCVGVGNETQPRADIVTIGLGSFLRFTAGYFWRVVRVSIIFNLMLLSLSNGKFEFKFDNP